MNNSELNKEVEIISNYYEIFQQLKSGVTENDFLDFLNQLQDENIKNVFAKDGMLSIPFQRWYLESKGYNLDEYLKEIK